MPTIEQNRGMWRGYDWSRRGSEWSHAWGGDDSLWYGTLFPRIHAFLPADTILEIAPGFGRVTHYLKDHCRRLIVVDLVEECVAACKQRFAASTNIEYHVNDGTSLDMVADGSIDFAFSFDSLVHVEADVMEAYVAQLGRKLKPDGVGFLHHSTAKDCLGDAGAGADGEPNAVLARVRGHWRAQSMSAALLREQCARAGLACIAQEIINWGTPYPLPVDCLSTFTPAGSPHARPNTLFYNGHFMREAKYLAELARLYSSPDSGA